MVIVMDMSTGKRLEPAARYNEEVLNANWIPREALQLGLQEVSLSRKEAGWPTPTNVDAFLRDIYRNQE